MRCADCGQPATTDLCTPCAGVAAALGHTVRDRLNALGVLPIGENQ